MSNTELHIGGTFADSKRRVLNAVAAAEAGAFESQTHITFESWTASRAEKRSAFRRFWLNRNGGAGKDGAALIRPTRYNQTSIVSNIKISAPPVAKFGTSAPAACPSGLTNAL